MEHKHIVYDTYSPTFLWVTALFVEKGFTISENDLYGLDVSMSYWGKALISTDNSDLMCTAFEAYLSLLQGVLVRLKQIQ